MLKNTDLSLLFGQKGRMGQLPRMDAPLQETLVINVRVPYKKKITPSSGVWMKECLESKSAVLYGDRQITLHDTGSICRKR